jgi:hypothetical protein
MTGEILRRQDAMCCDGEQAQHANWPRNSVLDNGRHVNGAISCTTVSRPEHAWHVAPHRGLPVHPLPFACSRHPRSKEAKARPSRSMRSMSPHSAGATYVIQHEVHDAPTYQPTTHMLCVTLHLAILALPTRTCTALSVTNASNAPRFYGNLFKAHSSYASKMPVSIAILHFLRAHPEQIKNITE